MEDHPKVYVGWAKHANFIDKNTGWNDPVSQLASTAFRSDDWWHLVKPGKNNCREVQRNQGVDAE